MSSTSKVEIHAASTDASAATRGRWSQNSRDLVVLGLFLLATYSVSISLDVFDFLFEFSRTHESWELDEIFSAVLLISAGLAFYSVRRWRESRRDLEARIQMQSALEQARVDAERANRAKSEFLSRMSHDIRTPMNGIIGMAELLDGTPLTHEQAEYLQIVRSSAESLLGLINDILDFSKIEAGKLDIDAAPFPLVERVEQMVRALAVSAHRKGIELIEEFATDVPEVVVGDPLRLGQVLVNLVGNAIKFTEAGEVSVRVSLAERGAEHAVVRVEVSDTGIGVEPDRLSAIFEAFEQSNRKTAQRFGGTGLGLVIARRLVELMGGTIDVKSTLGAGSTFTFTLRVGLASGYFVPEPMPAAVEDATLAGVPVLVVDDNAANRRVLMTLVEHWGMLATAVDGGGAALETLEELHRAGRPIRVVLLDARMPGMDGFEVAARVRERPELAEATILMLTSDQHIGDAARCRELGVAACIVKPLRPAELRATLCNVLHQQQPAKEEPRPSRPLSTADERSLRVLVVDDNEVNMLLAVRLLHKGGHQAVTARCGTEAIEKWQAEKFDVILMDVQMPGLDGYETTAKIRSAEAAQGGHVPIVALTANALKGDDDLCLRAGMDAYLAKPIRANQLLKVVREAAATTSA